MITQRKRPLTSLWLAFAVLTFCYLHNNINEKLCFYVYADEDAGDDNNNNDNGGDDYYNNVGANDDLTNYDGSDDKYYASKSSDYVKYWTNYAILPKRCIHYNGQDVVVFSVFDNNAKQCSDDPLGTYYEAVPTFFAAYMKQKYQDAYDQGNDYEEPSVIQYAYCDGFYINQVLYYLQVGCSGQDNSALAINVYDDDTCTTRSTSADGFDMSEFDVSDIQIHFKKCHNCVNWFDTNQEVDDGFYEKRMTEAPMCSSAWRSKQTCDRKCQKIGVEKSHHSSSNNTGGWNTSDHMLLTILSAFGLIMLGLIIRKRNKMSNKDALLEQAAMSAAGLQQPHLIGIFILSVVVIAVFALLGLKNITWALLLIINTALFAYLMKLTVDSSVSAGETIIGPDGTILRHDDSDDDSDDDEAGVGTSNGGSYTPASGVGLMGGILGNNLSTIAGSPACTPSTNASSVAHYATASDTKENVTASEYVENRASATSYVLPTLD